MSKNLNTALNVLAVVVGMLALAYSTPDLYRMFCKVTGFGGTTQEAKKIPDKIINHKIKVLFTTDVSPKLDWSFKPLQDTITLKVGEQKLAFFEATNIGSADAEGMATYNVNPLNLGKYFNKTQCFCFDKQVIKSGQKVVFPISFFIDPAIMDDKSLNDIKSVTLSYTFFPYEK